MAEPLFAVEVAESPTSVPLGNIPLGQAVEMRAVAELIERGHSVAIPVVDEGVDLIVDFRWRVQVKSSRSLSNTRSGSYKGKQYPRRYEYLVFNMSRKRADGTRYRYDVDVFLLFDAREDERVWYVVPASAMGSHTMLSLGPKYKAFRDAWHVFRELAA